MRKLTINRHLSLHASQLRTRALLDEPSQAYINPCNRGVSSTKTLAKNIHTYISLVQSQKSKQYTHTHISIFYFLKQTNFFHYFSSSIKIIIHPEMASYHDRSLSCEQLQTTLQMMEMPPYQHQCLQHILGSYH